MASGLPVEVDAALRRFGTALGGVTRICDGLRLGTMVVFARARSSAVLAYRAFCPRGPVGSDGGCGRASVACGRAETGRRSSRGSRGLTSTLIIRIAASAVTITDSVHPVRRT